MPKQHNCFILPLCLRNVAPLGTVCHKAYLTGNIYLVLSYGDSWNLQTVRGNVLLPQSDAILFFIFIFCLILVVQV